MIGEYREYHYNTHFLLRTYLQDSKERKRMATVNSKPEGNTVWFDHSTSSNIIHYQIGQMGSMVLYVDFLQKESLKVEAYL